MKCPACSASVPDGSAECPSCGVIFEKYELRKKRERAEAEAALASFTEPSRPIVNPRIGQLAAAALFFSWAGVMAHYVFLEWQKREDRRASLAAAAPSPIAPAMRAVAPPRRASAAVSASTSTVVLSSAAAVR